MSNNLFLTIEQIKVIDAYEQHRYTSLSRMAKMVNFLQTQGVVLPNDAEFVQVAIDLEKGAIGFEFYSATEETAVLTFTAAEYPELDEWFVLILTLAPALDALTGSEFSHVYNFSNSLADRVIVGDPTTYPVYLPQILPKYIDNPEYRTEGAQTVAMRFVHIGEHRTQSSIQATPAIVRYIIEMTDNESNNGFGEIYPVIMHGNYVEFNGSIMFPHTIMQPVSNETTIEFFKEEGALFQDAVHSCGASDSYWLYADGSKVPVN